MLLSDLNRELILTKLIIDFDFLLVCREGDWKW